MNKEVIEKMESCLGNSCRFYNIKPDTICFHSGVLPKCSPELKQQRGLLDNLTPSESLDLIKQLIENFKCKECDGSGKSGYVADPTKETREMPCVFCHGSGKDNEKLVEVIKLIYQEIDDKIQKWHEIKARYIKGEKDETKK